MTIQEHLSKYFLTESQVKIFKIFIKNNKLTYQNIALLDNDGRTKNTIRLNIVTKKIRISFANRVMQSYLKQQNANLEKYKDLKF